MKQLTSVVVAAVLAACGGGGSNSAKDGNLHGHCYPNATCNAGLTCAGGVCVEGLEVDAAVIHDGPADDASHDGHPDSLVIPDAAVPDGMPDSSVIPDAFVGVDAPTACSVLTQMGCGTNQKCTWVLATDPSMTSPGLGSNTCAPDGAVAVGGACTTLPAASGGYDNCIHGTVCNSGTCKLICDNNGGAPACGVNQACVTYDGLFANSASVTTPAGVCDPSCNPLDDNDFDGSGTTHTKIGTACGSSSTIGCYGNISSTSTTYFTCAPPAGGTETLTHRSVVPANKQYLNSCMSGYAISFASDATGSTNVDCYAWCKPGDAYLGNTGTQAPNGVAPHRCNNNDALGAFGPTATATVNGEHCVYSWFFELDQAGMLHKSPTSDTVGICWDHTKYQYDSNGDGTPDTVIEACGTLPLTQPMGSTAPSAVDWACVSTVTGGVMFAGKPKAIHHPYVPNLPEIRPLQLR